MKKLIPFLLCFLTIELNAQSILSSEGIREIRRNYSSLFNDYEIDLDTNKLMHNSVLNYFLAKQINSYLSGSGDFTLSQAYAVYDNSDDRLFLGGRITNKKKLGDKTSFILQGGIKTDIAENFSRLTKGGRLRNNIGLSFKATIFGNGSITLNTSTENNQKVRLRTQREYLLETIGEELEQKSEINISSANKLINSHVLNSGISKESVAQQLKSVSQSLLSQYERRYIEEETNFLIKNKSYIYSKAKWLSVEAYFPLTNSIYNFSPLINSTEFNEISYKPWEFDLSGNILWTWSNGFKLFFKFDLGIWANDVVQMEQVEKYQFKDFIDQNGNNNIEYAEIKSDEVYVGEFNSFWSQKIQPEVTIFLPGDFSWLGLSANVEFVFGEVESTNWKLGMPVSLKGKDDDSKVNFELQWKEQFDNHSLGLSIGLPLSSIGY